MTKEFAESLSDLEIQTRRGDEAAEISRRCGIPLDVAERIVEMSKTLDQAHALAELMR